MRFLCTLAEAEERLSESKHSAFNSTSFHFFWVIFDRLTSFHLPSSPAVIPAPFFSPLTPHPPPFLYCPLIRHSVPLLCCVYTHVRSFSLTCTQQWGLIVCVCDGGWRVAVIPSVCLAGADASINTEHQLRLMHSPSGLLFPSEVLESAILCLLSTSASSSMSPTQIFFHLLSLLTLNTSK